MNKQVENIEVPEHCNQQNSEPSVEETLKTKDDTQVKEVDQ